MVSFKYMGNRFDNRQVNSFLINQEVMSTSKNKFLLLIKIRSITTQLQLAQLQTCINNFRNLSMKLSGNISEIYVSFEMCKKIDFCLLKNNGYF